MRSLKQSISIVLFTASILGLFLSMAHTHSEGLECLYHVEDQHYIENDNLCPVCGIAAFTEPVNPSFTSFLFYERNHITVEAFFNSAKPFELLPSRAPPVMA